MPLRLNSAAATARKAINGAAAAMPRNASPSIETDDRHEPDEHKRSTLNAAVRYAQAQCLQPAPRKKNNEHII